MRARMTGDDPSASIDEMGLHPRYGAALALGIVLALAATVWAVSESRDRVGFDVADLLRVETLPDASTSRLDDQLQRFMDAWNGDRPWTDDELAARFQPALIQSSAADQNERDRQLRDDLGRISFIGFAEREVGIARAVMVTEDGTPLLALFILGDDGRLQTLGVDLFPLPPPLKGWATALALAAAWLFLLAGAASDRFGHRSRAWLLSAGSVVSLSAVLVLSRNELAYTAGRVGPALMVAVAVAVLAGGADVRSSRWLWTTTGAAIAAGAFAPFARDAQLIGHPPLAGAFTDDDALYRALLAVAAILTGAALAGVAAVNAMRLRRSSRWRRPPLWGAGAAAAIWSAAAFASAIDVVVGDGDWAGGSLRAASWVAFGSIPAVVGLGLVSSRWDSPELASLVVDLDARGSDLRSAIAKALQDDSVELLASEDGDSLIDDTGRRFEPAALPPERMLTQMRSHGTLVGGLVHDSALRIDPARLESIAATAGMALDVSRLNRRVRAQLDDVTASRARIVEASDAARRRIERDLHDGAQQRLVGLGLALQRARRLTGSASDDERIALLEDAGREVREILEDVRTVSRGSHPALLAERGLAAAIDALAERAPIPVRIDVASEQLPADTATTVYYVVAEALTNVAKHAHASMATVSVHQCNGTALVEITDDGSGGAEVRPGSGLQGLDDRVAAAGGSLSIDSESTGTTLEARIPCA